MKTLALDLGTRMGWAVSGARIAYGTVNLLPSTHNADGARWVNLRLHLARLMNEHGPIDVIVYEDVKNHGKSGVRAAHVYGGVKAITEMQAALWQIPCIGVGVGQVKKHATGKGNAKKGAMVEAARARGWDPPDDNAADALWILDYYLAHGRTAGPTPNQQDPA